MSQNLGLGYDPRYEGFDPQYPAPPRVHWLVLLLAWWAVTLLTAVYLPERFHALANSIGPDAWAFYLCNWIRRLETGAKSPFWCDVLVVVELGCVGLGTISHPAPVTDLIVALLGFASAILGIVTIFLIRSDLQDHYNNHEHAGLLLSGVMTFFFSFLYFQYHLYDIARRKQKAQSLMAGQLS